MVETLFMGVSDVDMAESALTGSIVVRPYQANNFDVELGGEDGETLRITTVKDEPKKLRYLQQMTSLAPATWVCVHPLRPESLCQHGKSLREDPDEHPPYKFYLCPANGPRFIRVL